MLGLAPCSHEEADTRMLLHLEDAVKQGYGKICIRTVDTDVVVLAIAAAQRLGALKCGLHLVQGRIFGIFQHMKLQVFWVKIDVLHCLCSMHLLDAILCHFLEVEARRLHGICGRHLMM